MSHTVKTKIEFKNQDALKATVEALGGTIVGEGKHRLFSSAETGFGFRLPNWRFPLIAKEDNTLAFDDYNGQWGNVADVTRLTEQYAVECIKLKCAELAWMYEAQPNGELLVYHPDGGTITVTPQGQVEANGFIGSGCSLATAPLIEALGSRTAETQKQEFNQQQQHIGVPE